ncbi:MAG TPA: MBL fold metallo-hydrolase [Micropepsaceae bacterium]|nr:MBL fold metallo-hydrolase [Micropepsaceae bacterium]
MSDALTVTILGCGSSAGVPRLGGPDGAGDWGACDPTNPKNRRRRCSILLRRGETTVLVDTSPDMRAQLLDARVSHLDAVLMTHPHADQTNGIDDLRPLTFLMKKRVDMYADTATLDHLSNQFAYCFSTPEGSEYPPIITGHVVPEPFREMAFEGRGGAIPARAFWQEHGPVRSLGYRFGPVAYSSDVSGLDEGTFAALEGIECWILDALRYRPHPTHVNVETALSWIARVKPKRAILTNLHIDLDYERLRADLPKGVEPAYDGMTITARLHGQP